MTTHSAGRATTRLAVILAVLAALLPPASAAVRTSEDGTERIFRTTPTGTAVAISQRRFAARDDLMGRRAAHVVLSRDDAFADSLAGAALAGAGPMLFTSPKSLSASTAEEIKRVLLPAGTVYLLGGPGAISGDVEQHLRSEGYNVQRLAGRSRVETALAVADEVRRRNPSGTVLLARAYGTEDNPGSAWADSVSGGAFAADRVLPVLVTATDSLHPAVAAWLRADETTRTVLLGGTSALSPAVEQAVPNPRRISGAERTATAANVATQLWRAPTSGARQFTVVNGGHEHGWGFGLAASGLAADEDAPVLLVTQQVTPAVRALAATCGEPQVALTVVGDGTVVPGGLREHLDLLDGNACGPEGELVLDADLDSFDSCEQTLSHYRSAALERVTPFGLGGGTYFMPGFGGGEEQAERGADSAPTPSAQPSLDESTSGRSGTNVQEAGVDEPDIVKDDGSLALAVAQGHLQIVDLRGDAPQLAASLPLPPGYGHQLFVHGSRALVFSHEYDAVAHPEPEPQPDDGAATMPAYVMGAPRTRLTLVDVSDPTQPRVESSLEVDGEYRSSRMVDGVARVVVHAPPDELEFSYPTEASQEAFEAAAALNRREVATSTLQNWLPGYTLTDEASGAEREGTLLGCAQVRQPSAFSGLGTLTVFTVDIAAGLQPTSSAAVVADGETVYASSGSLYVTTSRWHGGEPNFAPEAVSTEIHSFDIADPNGTRYRASGRVAGVILNQFSLSEHDGHLRIATTEQPPWDDVTTQSQSGVTVLAEQGAELVPVGHVGGLGLGERIFGVRFMGDLAAVVTFRQIDPLYLVDLADPTTPRLLGELKVPGYSAYLHRVSDDLLLGVGQDATEEGRVQGTQVSLFDIADRANPQRVDNLVFPNAHSEVEYDHKAFLFWPPSGLAVVPMGKYDENGPVFDAAAIGVGAADLSEVGRLSHAEAADQEPWLAQIRRSFVIGDGLYTVSETGLEVADLDTLTQRARVEFPRSEHEEGEVRPAA